MKQLKLLKLQLDNFKGLKHVVIHANGENFEMEAPNGVGKTTLFDAFSWILFDKDSKGNQLSSDIKTLDSLGVVIPKLKHEAIADFDLDGNRFELKKVFYEKYSSKRGSNEETFDGHTTDYYIDGIKKSKKEYESFISEIITEDIFKLLTNPHYFNENMDAKKRREKLFEIFGDIVKDEDIFELREDLSIVKKMIEKHTLQESIDKAKKELSDIDKELKSIPVQIKENQNQIFGSKKIDAKKLMT